MEIYDTAASPVADDGGDGSVGSAAPAAIAAVLVGKDSRVK
ncbi:unnamed protein product [Enterobius vermicularis]|uniref:Uncharacterized protein n=1 Tax=Enterobius vermicularis TaxID=51028 RepID=A0A0N4VNZ9_ENTVE|nr:unnamed protein product [Enterobius vermicularis]